MLTEKKSKRSTAERNKYRIDEMYKVKGNGKKLGVLTISVALASSGVTARFITITNYVFHKDDMRMYAEATSTDHTKSNTATSNGSLTNNQLGTPVKFTTIDAETPFENSPHTVVSNTITSNVSHTANSQ